MRKKILRIILLIVLLPPLLVTVVSALLYIPAVQNFVKERAASYVSGSLGMELKVERLRIKFPLDLTVTDALLTNQGDTVLSSSRVSVSAAVWPLLRGRIRARTLFLEDATYNHSDTLTGLLLRTSLERFTASRSVIDLRRNTISVGDAQLSGAWVDLFPGNGEAESDTTQSAPWKITAQNVRMQNSSFSMRTSPFVRIIEGQISEGVITQAEIDLAAQQIHAISARLGGGFASYKTDTLTLSRDVQAVADSLTDRQTMPWVVALDRVELDEWELEYGITNGAAAEGFDREHIAASGFTLRVDDFYNENAIIRAHIEQLRFQERSGIRIEQASGDFEMDGQSISVTDFALQLPRSRMTLDAKSGPGFFAMRPSAPLSIRLVSSVDLRDLSPLFAGNRDKVGILTLSPMRVNLNASGNLGEVTVSTLSVEMDSRVDLDASGRVSGITLGKGNLSGDVSFNLELNNAGELLGLLSDTAVRRNFGLPRSIHAQGQVGFTPNSIAPELMVSADGGQLRLEGSADRTSSFYDIRLHALDFPLQEFLPALYAGPVTADAVITGNTFDPARNGADIEFRAGVDSIFYRGHSYKDISLIGRLHDHLLSGELSSDNRGLDLDVEFDGSIYPGLYDLHAAGRIGELDLRQLNLADSTFTVYMIFEGRATLNPDTTYSAELLVDSARFSVGKRTGRITRLSASAKADPRSVNATVNSDDLVAELTSPMGLDSLKPRLNRTLAEIRTQIAERNLDMSQIQDELFPFRLKVEAGNRNLLHDYLSSEGVDFRKLSLNASTTADQPFRAAVVVNSLRTSGLTLDTLNVWMRRSDAALEYSIRLRNRPGNIEQMALIRVRGQVEGSRAVAEFYQRDRADSTGFRFGLDAELLDRAVMVKITPERPVFGYIDWSVNPDNYLRYDFDRRLTANIRLDAPDRHFYLLTEDIPRFTSEGLRLDARGIVLGDVYKLLPSPPPLDGTVSADVVFGISRSQMVARGNINVADLSYNSYRIGDVALDADLASDSLATSITKADLYIGQNRVLVANGRLPKSRTGGGELNADLTSLPLAPLNAFIPDDIIRLSGYVSGGIATSNLRNGNTLNGELSIADGRITVPVTGTSYTISSNRLSLSQGRVDLTGFGISSPNGQQLSLGGDLNIADLNNPVADLNLRATNFEVVQSVRSGGSQVYGRMPVNVDVTAQGTLDALAVKGDITVLSDTDVTYVMREGSLNAGAAQQDIVTFVSFEELDYAAQADSTVVARQGGMDILVNVDVESGVDVHINLTENGESRIDLEGEGLLTFTQNRQGDSRFTGRYEIDDGTVVYSPPIIQQKVFSVDPNSYVEWTGDIADPVFKVRASQTVRTTVTTEDDQSSNVNFEISVNVQNSLSELEIMFDLAAPGDLTIQNQLTSLSPDQRSQQAIALLVYNTYTGPGTTARVDVNNPLNSFIAKELNQWARNSIPGVDIAIGINTINDSATGGGQHTDYSYKVSKTLFDDRVKLTVGGSVSSGDTGSDELRDNFVDDIELEYRLSKRDNMFLKAYRYNTQESILEGEVTETGLSFVVRKKMNRLGELFRLRRDPQKREMKRERRELKQQIRRSEKEAGVDPAREQRQDDPLQSVELHANEPMTVTEPVTQQTNDNE